MSQLFGFPAPLSGGGAKSVNAIPPTARLARQALRAWMVLAVALATWMPAQAWALALNETSPHRINLFNEIEILEDRSGLLTLEQVSAPGQRALFKRPVSSGGELNLGFSSSTFWIKLPLWRSADSVDYWLLVVANSLIDEIDLFMPGQPPIFSGAARPITQRPVFSRHFLFPLKVPTAEQTVFIRVRSSGALTIPLTLWRPIPFGQANIISTLLQGLYQGGLLTILTYNFLVYLTLRDRRYLLYSAYSLSLCAAMIAANGYGRLFLWPEWVGFDRISLNVFFSLAGASAIAFSSAFLNLQARLPRLHKALKFMVGAQLAFALLFLVAGSLSWSVSPIMRCHLILSVLMVGLVISASVLLLRRGFTDIRFFLLSWGVLAVGVLVAVVHAFGLLPSNLLTANAIQIASAAEMMLLALALADQIREEREHNIRQQRLAIEQLRQAESRLEATVQERTKELQTALDQETQLREQQVRFAAMISHEFRNPLAIIDGQLTLLTKEHERGIDRLDKRASIIEGAVRRLTAMFDRWLESTRLDRSPKDLDRRLLDLVPWLHRQMQTNAFRLSAHKPMLDVRHPQLLVWADEYLLEIALGNLLDNAAKYSSPGSEIRIETRTRDGWVGIAVIDQGQGIAEHHRDSVFKEYLRIAPEGPVRGLGLGLSIAKDIVDAHNGQLELISRIGQGSDFCCWLPAATPSDETIPR